MNIFKKWFIKEVEETEEEQIERLGKDNEIYQTICAYIERNKDRDEDGFMTCNNFAEYRFGYGTLYAYRNNYLTAKLKLNNVDITKNDMPYILRNDICRKIAAVYHKSQERKRKHLLEKALKDLKG